MYVISWICQGAGNKETFRILNYLVTTHHFEVLVILEPRISGSVADSVYKKLKFGDWVRVESFGFSEGIWLF